MSFIVAGALKDIARKSECEAARNRKSSRKPRRSSSRRLSSREGLRDVCDRNPGHGRCHGLWVLLFTQGVSREALLLRFDVLREAERLDSFVAAVQARCISLWLHIS